MDIYAHCSKKMADNAAKVANSIFCDIKITLGKIRAL